MQAADFTAQMVGPRIHVLIRPSAKRPAMSGRERTTHSLCYLVDGAAMLDDASLRGPTGIFLQPDDGHHLRLAPRAEWWMVRFDFGWRPLRRLQRHGPSAPWILTPVDQDSPPPATAGRIWDLAFPTVLPDVLLPNLRKTMLACAALCTRGPTNWLRANYRLGVWWCDFLDFCEQGQRVSPEADPSFLAELRESVLRHLEHGVTVADLARLMGVSRSTIDHRLKASGRGPRNCSELIGLLRIERAQELLLATDLSIGAIAAACGFRQQGALTRAFKTRCGCSPSEWRRQQR